MTKSVPQALKDLGKIYEERNAVYGDNYLHFGQVMMGMFPRGLTLETEDDFNRFALFVWAASKLTRYAQSFNRGGHADSCDDASVYMQMLNEVDGLVRDKDIKRTL